MAKQFNWIQRIAELEKAGKPFAIATVIDTKYAFHEGSKMSFQNIFSKIKLYDCKTVTVTGGEPLSQNNILLLLDELCENDYLVSIETSNAITIKNINIISSPIIIIQTTNNKFYLVFFL